MILIRMLNYVFSQTGKPVNTEVRTRESKNKIFEGKSNT